VWAEQLADLYGAPDRPHGPIEGCEETIAGRGDLNPGESVERVPRYSGAHITKRIGWQKRTISSLSGD
jgi:hypothetical protein